MVDVGDKAVTHRVAVAGGLIRMLPETFEMVCAGTHKKGDVLGIARIAGIMAAKKTSDLIPFVTPSGSPVSRWSFPQILPLRQCTAEFKLKRDPKPALRWKRLWGCKPR